MFDVLVNRVYAWISRFDTVYLYKPHKKTYSVQVIDGHEPMQNIDCVLASAVYRSAEGNALGCLRTQGGLERLLHLKSRIQSRVLLIIIHLFLLLVVVDVLLVVVVVPVFR